MDGPRRRGRADAAPRAAQTTVMVRFRLLAAMGRLDAPQVRRWMKRRGTPAVVDQRSAR